MRRVAPALLGLATLACGPDEVSLAETSTGESAAESSASESSPSETTQDTTGEGGLGSEDETSAGGVEDMGPPIEPDPGCEVEVLWSYLESGGSPDHGFNGFARTPAGQFVLGGGRANELDHARVLLGIESGAIVWEDVQGSIPPMAHFPHVGSISVGDGGTMFVLGVGFEPSVGGRVMVYTTTGELLWMTPTPGQLWSAMTRDGDELVLATTDPANRFARFDAEAQLLDEVEFGGGGSGLDQVRDLHVDEGRIWAVGARNYCASIAEYAPDGTLLWSKCTAMEPDVQAGRLSVLASLDNGILVGAGGVAVEKPIGDAVYTYSSEPFISAWTREGEPVFQWRPGPDLARSGHFFDLEVLPGGDFVSVTGERDLLEPGGPPFALPVIYRHTDAGELVARCALDPSVVGDQGAVARKLALGPDGEIFVLLAENDEGGEGDDFAILEISELEP